MMKWRKGAAWMVAAALACGHVPMSVSAQETGEASEGSSAVQTEGTAEVPGGGNT